jgi:hypothetical protein
MLNCTHYRVEEPSFDYGYVPALTVDLFVEETGEYIDTIYVYCLRGYDIRAATTKDLNGRSMGISSGISSIFTADEDIIYKVEEAVNAYLRRPDTVKEHGQCEVCGSIRTHNGSLISDPELMNFARDTLDFIGSIRLEGWKPPVRVFNTEVVD